MGCGNNGLPLDFSVTNSANKHESILKININLLKLNLHGLF